MFLLNFNDWQLFNCTYRGPILFPLLLSLSLRDSSDHLKNGIIWSERGIEVLHEVAFIYTREVLVHLHKLHSTK